MEKYTQEYIEQELNKNGYTLLTGYINSKSKMKLICPNGHQLYMDWNHFNRGRRCAECLSDNGRRNAKYTIQQLRDMFHRQGYQLISTEYINSKHDLQIKCDKGHAFKMTLSNFNKGQRCPVCGRLHGAQLRKYDLEYVKQYFIDQGCIPLFDKYITARDQLEYICTCGNVGHTPFGLFKIGHRCLNCRYERMISSKQKYEVNGCQVSNQQIYIHDLIGGQMNYVFGRYSLDIAFPNEKIYLQYDGSGHRLSVDLGSISAQQFDRKEKFRKLYLESYGWRGIRIISDSDKLPTKDVLLNLVRIGKEHLKSSKTFNIDLDNRIVTADGNKIDYNLGILKCLPRNVVTTEIHISDNMDTANSAECG